MDAAAYEKAMRKYMRVISGDDRQRQTRLQAMTSFRSISENRVVLMTMTLSLLTLLLSACSGGKRDKASTQEQHLTEERLMLLDSIKPPFVFYPERWTTDGMDLWIISSGDSFFLKRYSPESNQVLWSGGSIGRGHLEYISPGIVEGISKGRISLYSNTLGRVDEYSISEEPVMMNSAKLPVWNEMHGMPKPYTRMARVNDSIVIGTYFLPRKAGADIINVSQGALVSDIPLGITQSEETPSGPYEFKVAADSSHAVVAYRYIDRLEFYSVSPNGITTLTQALGNDETQMDLYNADRDDEMVKYYSDVFVYGGYLFVLRQNIEDGRMGDANTHLLVFDLASGINVENIALGREVSELQVLPDIDRIVFYSMSTPNVIYECKLSDVVRDL